MSKKIPPSPSGACWDCAQDPADKLKQMFVDIVQTRRIKQGQDPARRPVFLKLHGVAHGHFEVKSDLPSELQVGVFALDKLQAWVRFSSDTVPTSPDLKTTCGIGIKLFGVDGPKLLGDGDTQDFVMQNHDVFFVDTALDMCEFTRAGVVDGDYGPYLAAHPKTQQILNDMEKVEASVLTASYWGVLPYAFGAARYVKYKLESETPPAIVPPGGNPDYLALDLARRLRDGEARFRFMVQFQTDPATMPLDQATVRWSEQESPFIQLATLVLPRQDIAAQGQASYGENLAFNPWHALAVHAPQGSISEVRKAVYAASADERRNVNGVPLGEPDAPRPAVVLPPVKDTCIVRAAIHPAIGIARVGNSEKEFFYGPEVIEPLPEQPGFYRDATGALKRQAARFRIYGLNAEGEIVAELTAADADIHWSVELANQKASWYEFQIALDIPEANSAPPSYLRNQMVLDRSTLTIKPGVREIHGRNVHGSSHAFNNGKFLGKRVYLGELRTDEEGRLVVLGGHGKSASYNGARAITFANNNGWYDDTADGPVTATVKFQGKTLRVDPAWVVVAPPNYAPQQKSVRTMWDLMRDLFITAGTLPRPARPSFENDIRPIFERLSHLQWVNAGFAAYFGWGGPSRFDDPQWLARLSKNTAIDAELRKTIANQFRVFDRDAWAPSPWPWLYGDAMSIPPAPTPRQNAALSDTQLRMLGQWAAGDFIADYNPAPTPPRYIGDVPLAQQGDMLDRAALEFCLADAFHPGCEMTWPMRHATMYAAPYRIAHRPPDWVEPNYGAILTTDTITLPDGPLAAQAAGGITRWMAVPWQTDTASCRSGYMPEYDPYVPTFWPARVPNQVLTKQDYEIVMDGERPLGERLAAFANRAAWIRPLGKGYTNQINSMIQDISQMGVVEVQPGPQDDPHFPSVMEVENLPQQTRRLLAALPAAQQPSQADSDELRAIEKVRRFPHGIKR
jgi:L-Lysine epsilon oxidase N-terminal/L-lysine epsilon oxidase C-terminal domain